MCVREKKKEFVYVKVCVNMSVYECVRERESTQMCESGCECVCVTVCERVCCASVCLCVYLILCMCVWI